MTKYVVDRFANEFYKHQIAVYCFRIETAYLYDIAFSEYDVLGIAYPVHAFNAPEIVINFVKQSPKLNRMDTFIIHTAGEDNKLNYASSDLLIKKLNGKGYKVFYNKLIEMPSNFIVKYDAAKVNRLIEKANEDIPHIARDIMKLTPYFMRKSFIAAIMAVIGKTEWFAARIMGKFLYVKDNCNRCGKCVDNCPNKNIVPNNKSVGFKLRCGMCMRCVYQCPKGAICVRRPFRFIRFDKWYDLDF